MTSAKTDEPFLRAPVPHDAETERRSVDLELECDQVLVGKPDAEASLAPTAQHQRKLEAIFGCPEHRAALRALGRPEPLVGHNALRELDKSIVDLAFGDPHLPRADKPPAVASERQGKRPQPQLETQRSPLEYDVLTPCRYRWTWPQHARNVLRERRRRPPPFTRRSHKLFSFFTGFRRLQGNLLS
jgi:hypothetical protein